VRLHICKWIIINEIQPQGTFAQKNKSQAGKTSASHCQSLRKIFELPQVSLETCLNRRKKAANISSARSQSTIKKAFGHPGFKQMSDGTMPTQAPCFQQAEEYNLQLPDCKVILNLSLQSTAHILWRHHQS